MSEVRHKAGLLLVGHGTRSAMGIEQFLLLAERIRNRSRGKVVVEPAFLELAQPDIDSAVERLVDAGIERLVTLPLLLFAAGHAKEDVPRAVAEAISRRGRVVEQVQAAHLGCHSAMVELSELRADEAARGFRVQGSGFSSECKAVSRQETNANGLRKCLLLVGRGSHDASATAEMHQFAALRQRQIQSKRVEVAFLAMARPLLAEQLPVIGRQGYRRVIVQPHLLFHGELVDSIERQVAEARNRFSDTEWITTQGLADLPGNKLPGEKLPGDKSRATELLEKVILDRCQEAGIHVVAAEADD